MAPRWAALSARERESFRATIAFLDGRMEKRATVEWALRLHDHEQVKRVALLHLLDSPTGRKLSEPWQSAWRLIEESWDTETRHHDSQLGVYEVRDRLKNQDRSGALVNEIATLVKPTLKAQPFSELSISQRNLPRRPKKVVDIMDVSMTSGDVIDPAKLGLGDVKERAFLVELVDMLDAVLVSALHLARRIGWDGKHRLWRLGELFRVYFVPVADRPADEHEPDEFHRGIAPLVKLLFAVVTRLSDVEISEALVIAGHWKIARTPIHARLWAALARDPRMASPSDVFDFLRSCDAEHFWDLRFYPEIAELRARRFNQLDEADQRAVFARLRRQPPRTQWPKDSDRADVDRGRLYWTLRELRRIEIAGGRLPDNLTTWIAEHLAQIEDLRNMARVDKGFLGMPKARHVPPRPENRYDLLAGVDRLNALEKALAAKRPVWEGGPEERASDWLRQEGRAEAILADFERAPEAGADYPETWNLFGSTHRPPPVPVDSPDDVAKEVAPIVTRVLDLLEHLPDQTLQAATEGISTWLDGWRLLIASSPKTAVVWLRVWPFAVDATNAQQATQKPPDLNVVTRTADDQESMELDALNPPVGRLLSVFLELCPGFKPGDRPFNAVESLREMRDAAVSAPGRSGLIARHRMIENLQWFLRADPDWANEHLMTLLRADNDDALALWQAVARRTRFTDVLTNIGGAMAERAVDFRLGRETRRSLVFNLVVDSLHAFRGNREPAVPNNRVQQMLRSLDDEVRGTAAQTVQQFVRELSSKTEHAPNPSSAEQIFRDAVRPFLTEVWPQERSLATPGVARGLADLPATCGEAFAEVVDVVERFLVPFDCWSMFDYGLYGEKDDEAKLSKINDKPKAEALLRLLDRTIGTAEGAVVPTDLGNALEQVTSVASELARTQPFRRLAALARR